MDNREVNQDYATIGAKLIMNEPLLEDIKNSEATIIYLSSFHKINNYLSLISA